ncbi:MAG: hypothetical protein ACYCXN_13585 [Acidimicrobiales bacterium]
MRLSDWVIDLGSLRDPHQSMEAPYVSQGPVVKVRPNRVPGGG